MPKTNGKRKKRLGNGELQRMIDAVLESSTVASAARKLDLTRQQLYRLAEERPALKKALKRLRDRREADLEKRTTGFRKELDEIATDIKHHETRLRTGLGGMHVAEIAGIETELVRLRAKQKKVLRALQPRAEASA